MNTGGEKKAHLETTKSAELDRKNSLIVINFFFPTRVLKILGNLRKKKLRIID